MNKTDLLAIQFANIIPKIPARMLRVGPSEALMEEADTDPEDETEWLGKEEVKENCTALFHEIVSQIGNRTGVEADFRGLEGVLIRCLKNDTVSIKNLIQHLVEKNHGRLFKEFLKRDPEPALTYWLPTNYESDGKRWFAYVLYLISGDVVREAKIAISMRQSADLVAVNFKRFFSELTILSDVLQAPVINFPDQVPLIEDEHLNYDLPAYLYDNDLNKLIVCVSNLYKPGITRRNVFQRFPSGYGGVNHVAHFYLAINPVPNFERFSTGRFERLLIFKRFLELRYALQLHDLLYEPEEFFLELIIYKDEPLSAEYTSERYRSSRLLRDTILASTLKRLTNVDKTVKMLEARRRKSADENPESAKKDKKETDDK